MKQLLILFFLGVLFVSGCKSSNDEKQVILPAPGFDAHVYFNLFKGYPYYMVYHYDQKIVDWSAMGFNPSTGIVLNSNMEWVDVHTGTDAGIEVDDGGAGYFHDVGYNALSVQLRSSEDPSLEYFIDFRAFDGGIAFRYRFHTRKQFMDVKGSEATEFVLNTDNMHWVLERDDSISNDPNISMPATLVSHRQYMLTVDEFPHAAAVLKPDAEHALRYSVATGVDTTQTKPSGKSTPWRILLITKNTFNE